MNFERQIEQDLTAWKESKNRKPLILRGARQVGKTTVVNHFAKTYRHAISLNLERPADVAFFKDYTDANTIVEALLVTHNISSNHKSDTLLFIDEIQEAPEAIAMLRYFYEDVPELHVIAAGSLLEHAMRKVKSFPVGRVTYLYLYPLNFGEFLKANGFDVALAQLHQVPVVKHAHVALLKLFHQYAIMGGMPEVVSTFIDTDSVSDLKAVYESIWGTYKDDVEKYASSDTDAKVIKHIMNTAHLYVDQRIKFENFGRSNYRSREVGESLRNLDDARIIQLIYPTTEVTPPLIPNLKKAPRLQFLDTGLINHELNIQAELLGMDDFNKAYKGAIMPHLITQEVLSLNTNKHTKPNFWVREKAQSSSEVDLVLPYQNMVIPIEIKSGKQGTLKSLHQFMDRVNHPYAIRIYAGEFSVEQHKTPVTEKPYLLMNLPYYLGTKLPEYIAWFVREHGVAKG